MQIILLFVGLTMSIAYREGREERIRRLEIRLNRASWEGDYRNVRRLLRVGINPNAPDEYGKVPLANVIEGRAINSFEAKIGSKKDRSLEYVNSAGALLYDPRIDPNAFSRVKDGFYPVLTLATAQGLIDIFSMLLNHPLLDPNKKDSDGFVAMQHALTRGLTSFVDILLDDKRTDATPCIEIAVGLDDNALLEKALSTGRANINERDSLGWTQIMRAKSNAQTDIERTLRIYGAEFTIVDQSIAIRKREETLTRLLR